MSTQVPEGPSPIENDRGRWRMLYAITLLYGVLTILALLLFTRAYEV